MKEYVFQCRTLTPMFVGGADNTRVDLTPASLRGPMRFWFRAMMGAILADNMKDLHKLETAAFGATDAASPFILRVSEAAAKTPPGGDYALKTGYGYLAFSLYDRPQKERNGRQVLKREYINVDQPFTVRILFRRPDPLLEQVVLRSFWLLAHFGGIGSRSRRGFGAFRIVSQAPNTSIAMVPQPGLPLYFRAAINEIIPTFGQFAQREVGSDQRKSFSGDWQYTCITPMQIAFLQRSEWQNGQDVLDNLGAILRGLRLRMLHEVAPHKMTQNDWRTQTYDYWDTIGPLMDGRPIDHVQLNNLTLGLPYMMRSSSRGITAEIASVGSKKIDRRASPLFLRPIQLSNNQYAAVIAVFHAALVPPDAELRLKIPGRGDRTVTPVTKQNYSDLYKYLFGELQRHYGAQFMRLMPPPANR